MATELLELARATAERLSEDEALRGAVLTDAGYAPLLDWAVNRAVAIAGRLAASSPGEAEAAMAGAGAALRTVLGAAVAAAENASRDELLGALREQADALMVPADGLSALDQLALDPAADPDARAEAIATALADLPLASATEPAEPIAPPDAAGPASALEPPTHTAEAPPPDASAPPPRPDASLPQPPELAESAPATGEPIEAPEPAHSSDPSSERQAEGAAPPLCQTAEAATSPSAEAATSSLSLSIGGEGRGEGATRRGEGTSPARHRRKRGGRRRSREDGER